CKLNIHLCLQCKNLEGDRPYTASYDVAQTSVFSKQSLGPGLCNRHELRRPKGSFTLLRPPFSRSYGCNLPSSLTRVLSIALVFSTCPPASVWGTGTSSTR